MSETFLFDGVERPLTPEMLAQREADAEAAAEPPPSPPPPAVDTMTIEELQQLLLAAQARIAQLAGG